MKVVQTMLFQQFGDSGLSVQTQINEFTRDNKISQDRLIDIKYQVKYENGEPHTYALLIYLAEYYEVMQQGILG